ncbi:MAG: hypothetical protein H0U44_10940 [Flavisolibacter sp.]|jgi:hypothetical protein|nr:hypothetical protein [Flavisolibacter sp.]
MKKIFYLLSFISLISFASFAQDDEGGRMPEKMAEYIASKLELSKSENEKFKPTFLEYLKELRKTTVTNRGDRLVLQQQIVELRLRYRDIFKSQIGEKKSNEVFFHEREFIREVQELRRERRGNQKRNLDQL